MSAPPPHPPSDPTCPFCAIATAFPPATPSSALTAPDPLHPETTFPPTYVILSTPDVVAFLDIAPLTRGHVLIATRRHRVKTVDLTTKEGAEVGALLPLLARSILLAVFPDQQPSDADYNIVQNNGPRAAQVIPHVHFHIIPRPPSAWTSAPSFAQQSWLSFGRGTRTELDDEDAAVLVRDIRRNIANEVARIKAEEGVDLELGWEKQRRRTERSRERL